MNMPSISALPVRMATSPANLQRPALAANRPATQPEVKFGAGDFGQGFADAIKFIKIAVASAFVIGVGGALGIGYWLGGSKTEQKPPAAVQQNDQPSVSDKQRIEQLEQRLKDLEAQKQGK